MNHAEVRTVVIAAFARQFPDVLDPPRSVHQALQGIGLLESGYGKAWKQPEGKVSYNVGAVQSSRPPCDPAKSFEAIDTHPNADGTSTPYHICFKKYPTLVEGFADVARIMFREAHGRRPALEAAIAGDLYGVSAAMRAQGYYEGFGRTQAERIANHHKALLRAVTSIARALGESLPDGSSLPPPTIRRGSRGEAVKDWQRELNSWQADDVDLVVDGSFGPATESMTKAWQSTHGLTADGVVGPKTWAAANGDE